MTSYPVSEPNLSLLLEPISSADPCGESLRYSELYDQIREARREDDDKLPQGIWKTEIKKADWDQVDRLCQEALKTRSKDLQIAAWLTEAWLHLEGISGLARGLELILGLSRTFWDTIHPQMNNVGYELRLGPYEWMNMRLSEECQHVLISMPSDRSVLPSRLLDFNEVQRLELLTQKNPSHGTLQSVESPKISRNKISLSIEKTPTAFYQYMNESCSFSLKLIADLEEELRFQLEGEAPTFYRLREKIEGIQRFIGHVLDNRGEKKKEKKLATTEVPYTRPSKKPSSGAIESREQAYSVLGEVAAYLERIEPHSPTPYLIRRAIAWGGMSLPQVFADTLTNGKDLSLLLDVLNIEKNQKGNAG